MTYNKEIELNLETFPLIFQTILRRIELIETEYLIMKLF